MPTLPPGMFPPPIPPNPGQQTYGQHLPPGHDWGDGPEPPFSDVFDFSLSTYVAPVAAKVLYAMMVILTIVSYLGGVITTFVTTLPDHDLGLGVVIKGSPYPGLAALLLGWIPALLVILGTRLGVEQVLANVRTAMDVRRVRDRYLGLASR